MKSKSKTLFYPELNASRLKSSNELDPSFALEDPDRVNKLLQKVRNKIKSPLQEEPVIESLSVKRNDSAATLNNIMDTYTNVARGYDLANSNVPENSSSMYDYEDDLKNFETTKGIKTDALGNPIASLNAFANKFERRDIKKNIIPGLTQKHKNFQNIETEEDFFNYRVEKAKELSKNSSFNLPRVGDNYYPASKLTGQNMGEYKNQFIDDLLSQDEFKNLSLTEKSNLIRKYRLPIKFRDIGGTFGDGTYGQVIDRNNRQEMEIDLRHFADRTVNGDGKYNENWLGERFKKLNPVLQHELAHAEHGFGAAGTQELLDFTKNSLGIKNSNKYINNSYSDLEFNQELGARYSATKYLLGINKKGSSYLEFKNIVTPKLDSLIKLKRRGKDINVEQVSSISDELLGTDITKSYTEEDLKNLFKIYNKF